MATWINPTPVGLPRRRWRGVAVGLVMAMLVTACGADGGPAGSSPTSTTADATTPNPGATAVGVATTLQPPAVGDLPEGSEPVDLDPADFTTQIDNPYWPMDPGTRWTYRETDGDGTELEVVVVVTTLTKVIANGITARVVRDTVTEDGVIIEDTFDWYAQDADGNVWYLGEDTAEFEAGQIVSRGGSFEAGVDGALPGIIMPANPLPGMKYRQEYYAGEAEDSGEVLSIGETAESPSGRYQNVLLTEDTTGLDPAILEHKYYAIGVGPVLVLDLAGGGREELLSVDHAPESAGTGPLGNPNP